MTVACNIEIGVPRKPAEFLEFWIDHPCKRGWLQFGHLLGVTTDASSIPNPGRGSMFVEDDRRRQMCALTTQEAAAMFHPPVRGGRRRVLQTFHPYGVRVGRRRTLQTFNRSGVATPLLRGVGRESRDFRTVSTVSLLSRAATS
jgi:hypothetical protein